MSSKPDRRVRPATRTPTRATALVSGALANKPLNGGNAWTRLSWVLGLRRLGYRVLFVEQIGDPLEAVHRDWFQAVMSRHGLADTCALINPQGKTLWGLAETRLRDVAAGAEVLLNISGHLTVAYLKEAPRCRIYYDDDPGYTQFWYASGKDRDRVDGHDTYYTLGVNIGTATCSIPSSGISWKPIRPPVVLDDWPVVNADPVAGFTTVASWRGAYGPVTFGDTTYGLKAHEFRRFWDLPSTVEAPCEIALDIHPADGGDHDALLRRGWHIVAPDQVADSPDSFRRYVQRSTAEFSVAQGIYVETGSGWFSDRTTRYLASGRPALVQDTGFSEHLPVGEGLVCFRNMDEARAGAERILRDYPAHCRAARGLAESHFDSDGIIRKILEDVGAPVP